MIPVILKGDTTAKISLNIADGWDYTGVVLDVEFCGVVKTIVEPVAGSVLEVVYAADETARFPLGTHKVIMTLRGEGGERSTLPWGKIKVTDAPAEVYDAQITVDPGVIAVEDATAADSLGDVKEKLNAVLEYLRGTAVTACAAIAFALPCFGAWVQTATLNDLPGTAQVVTNVTFDGLATMADVTNATANAANADAALLAIYYPDGNVTSLDQITTEGLEYTYDDATMTATLSKGLDATGDVVIPWEVTKDGKEYKVIAVGDNAFFNDTEYVGANISSVAAPTTVTTIESNAFLYCTSLTSVSLPSVTTIEGGAFYGCTSLTSVSLPSVTTIETEAFYRCTSLTSVSLPLVTTIEDSSFSDCFALTSVSLPLVTTIGFNVFLNCIALTSVSLPSVTTIKGGAFSGCIALTSVSLPSATTIKDSAFIGCPSLTSVSLPSATSIFDNTFDGCTSLTSVDFGPTPRDTVPTLKMNAFEGVPTTCKFIVPLGMYDEWIAADGWGYLYAAGYKFMGYADAAKVVTAPAITNIARAVVTGEISPDNAAFSNAVLGVGIGVDTNAVAAINALLDGEGDTLPVGGAATVGGLLAALAAALAALKKKVMEKYPFVAAAIAGNTLTLTPYSRNALTSDGTAFVVTMGGNNTHLRDCVFVVTAGNTAPTISWPVNFHPRTDAATDFACVAGAVNVYWVTEYAEGKFAVAGWQETEGGNA